MNNKSRAKKIISGGQTGVDRGALDACLKHAFPCGGWCPKNRQAEDGKIDRKYPLKETDDESYGSRTKLNVADSDGTLIISHPKLSGGTLLTKQLAIQFNKPFIVVSAGEAPLEKLIQKIYEWMTVKKIEILNIAGPRESEWKSAHETSFKITGELIKTIIR